MAAPRSSVARACRRIAGVVAACALLSAPATLAAPAATPKPGTPWTAVPSFEMRGGLAAFWDVKAGKFSDLQEAAALRRGFKPLTLIGTYSDYANRGRKEDINRALSTPPNPWARPPFFERTVRRNIGEHPPEGGPYIHDIEIPIATAAAAWAAPALRRASGARDARSFAEAYHRAWADWFVLPLQWTKETYRAPVGIYGLQPFRRDYWGIVGKTRAELERSHAADLALWRRVDPYVDFYIASIYAFYDDPGTVMYFAANVEENYLRSRRFGNKPVYAYAWLRFHPSDRKGDDREVTPYLIEAMAITPFFSGARAVALWGWEPQHAAQDASPYETLPVYTRALARIAALSDRIGRGRLVIDTSAQELWNARRPLIRKVESAEGECVVMAINPWQAETARSTESVACGRRSHQVVMRGKRTTLVLLRPEGAQEY
jgi:hypothetical protein